jgi:hypothetical protein
MGAATRIMYGVEQALRELLGKVAEDYGLDYVEMEQRYFGGGDDLVMESIASSPPVRKEGTSSLAKKEGTKKKAATSGALCEGFTTKGAPCKKKAVAGGCFCVVHSASRLAAPKKSKAEGRDKVPCEAPDEHSEAPDEHSEAPDEHSEASDKPTGEASDKPTGEAPKKKASGGSKKKGSKKKKEEPVGHSHPVEEGVHEGCDGCEVHGSIADSSPAAPASPVYEVRGSVKTRMMEMLSRVAALEDEVVEEEAE